LCLTVLCVLVAPKARADDADQKTTVTFTDPVEVPGVGQHILPSGTYVFKLKNSSADRHIVEIFNQDGSKVLTTLLTVPNRRLKPTSTAVLTFTAQPTGQPAALKAWFHAGEHSGEQFVWDRSRATELAKQSNEAVLSTPVVMVSASVDSLNTAPLEAVNAKGEMISTAQVVDATPTEDAAMMPAPAIVPAPGVVMPPAGAVATVPTTPATDPNAATLPPSDASASVTPAPAVVPAPVVPMPSADASATVTPTPASDTATITPPPADASTSITPATAVVPAPVVPMPPVDASATVPPTPATDPAAATPPPANADTVAVAPAVAPTPVAPMPPVEATATVATPAPPSDAVALDAKETPSAHSLPQTASDLSLIGLAGLLAIGAGFGLLGLSKMRA